MSELSGLSTSMLLNILRVCTDSRVQRGRELEYVRVVREATEEALAGESEAPEPQLPTKPPYGPHCRTMPSQRPCGNVHCVRPECNTF